MRFELVAALCLSLSLVGCGIGPASPSAAVTSTAPIQGSLHGGQQPIVGAHIYVFAAGTSGYGQPAVSRVWQYSGHQDTSGGATNGDYYVLTDANGNFGLQSEYTCDHSDDLLYIYAQGGNAGAGMNSAIGGLAILGTCANPAPYININEVTTVAAAYAMAGFAVDATHVASSGTALAKVGITNAFANAGNLVNIASGAALATTPAGNGTVPQATINTLADILAACINSNGPASTGCQTLLPNALSGGTTGTQPTDTATAAINIAHNPTANIAALYGNPTPVSPFIPTLSSQPNDFTLEIQFSGAAFTGSGVSIDGTGNVWIANSSANSISKFSSLGVVTGGGTFTGGGMKDPAGLAIDKSGNVWTANYYYPASISEFSNSGAILSGSTGYDYSQSYFFNPAAVAIDNYGNAWIANSGENSASAFSPSRGFLSGTYGYGGGGLNKPFGIAIDGSGNAWLANRSDTSSYSTVTKMSNNGISLSGTSGFTSGNLSHPDGIAIDAQGAAWVTNLSANVTRYSNVGVVMSGSLGYSGGGINGPTCVAIDGAGSAWIGNSGYFLSGISTAGAVLSGNNGLGQQGAASGIAVDGSGDVWIVGTSGLSEFIGVAAPVITPIAAGLPATPTVDGSSNLGTRP